MGAKYIIILKGDFMINVKTKRFSSKAKTPTYGSSKAACMDLYACIDDDELVVPPHTTVKIGTGWGFQPPEGYYGAMYARSGMAAKQGLRLANSVAICDEDYTGEYIIALHNDSNFERVVHNGDRIAQLKFEKYEPVTLEEVSKLQHTDRGDGGFGSTGVK